jgi:hypothetical protein
MPDINDTRLFSSSAVRIELRIKPTAQSAHRSAGCAGPPAVAAPRSRPGRTGGGQRRRSPPPPASAGCGGGPSSNPAANPTESTSSTRHSDEDLPPAPATVDLCKSHKQRFCWAVRGMHCLSVACAGSAARLSARLSPEAGHAGPQRPACRRLLPPACSCSRMATVTPSPDDGSARYRQCYGYARKAVLHLSLETNVLDDCSER